MATSPLTAAPLDLSEGALHRTVVRLAWPAILENLLFSLVHFSDTLIVGWLRNEDSLAAALLAGTISFLISAPFTALAIAATSLVARSWGERDVTAARHLAGQSVALSFLFALVTLLLFWPLAAVAIRLMGGSPEVVALGAPYLRVILLSTLLGLPMLIANGIMRGTGDTRSPMFITLIMNAVNIAVSIALAFGAGPIPAIGLIGVAWGTAVARSIGGLLAFGVLAGGRHRIHVPVREFFTLSSSLLQRVWRLASPAIAERLLTSGSHVMFMGIVGMLGTTALAAHNIALHVESLAWLPAMGISVAVTTVFGQAVGAGRPDIADRALRRAMVWTVALMLSLSLLFVGFGRPVAHLFGATPAVVAMAGIALQISAIEHPLTAWALVQMGALRGAGDTRSPLWVAAVCILLCRFGVVYLFAIVFGWGLPGVWLATAVDWGARALGLWWVYRRGAWREVHAREKALVAAAAAKTVPAAAS